LKKNISERGIVALIASVQFVNVLDFMMVMPLGPDFARALHIPTSHLGFVGGSYTAAGAVAGISGSFFLDRFDRRKALFVSMLGLALATLLGGLAVNLETLLATRVLAGLFGGPATSLSYSIVADVVAPERRGRAMSAVMGAFSIASIAGVPLALELARVGGWRMPFFMVGASALLVTCFSIALLPPMRAHLNPSAFSKNGTSLFKRPEVIQAYLAVAFAMFGSFLMIPNLSAFFQANLHYPRNDMGFLYFVGGIVSFFVMRVAGRLVDRYSASSVAFVSAIIVLIVLGGGYIAVPPVFSPLLMFTLFMMGMSMRGVVVSSLASRVPASAERARYMSFQSAVQHIACALGAFASTQFLREGAGGILIGMPTLAIVTSVFSALVPFLLRSVEIKVRRKEQTSRLEMAQL
jgi:predicted MFS family arabinose efflux permease